MGTVIWFAVANEEGRPMNLLVDGDAKAVTDEILTSTREPRLVRLERKGESVWVNPAQVLYVEEGSEGDPQVGFMA
jgi:hypothetical protein